MKELSIEQKAKAYDEALKAAIVAHKDENRHLKATLERIFPELKESEDERIRKRIIQALHGDVLEMSEIKEAVDWLEKQGKQILANSAKTCKDEQKPAMIQWKGDNLKEVVDFTGVYKEGFEKWFHNSWEEYEKYVHEHNNIFKIFNEDGSHMEVPVGAWIIKAPDGYNTASRFAISPILTEISIESNFKFKKAIECIENYVNSFPHSQGLEIWQHINFLKSLKATTQQEWSEEDESVLNALIRSLEGEDIYVSPHLAIDWLKSLKERYTWKPSDEQMAVLNEVINYAANSELQYWSNFIYTLLKSLREQLKKLREE